MGWGMSDPALILNAAGAAMAAAVPPGRRGRISVHYDEPGLGITITKQDTGAWLAVVYDTTLNRLLGAETMATLDAATAWVFSRPSLSEPGRRCAQSAISDHRPPLR
jgi:hypothetical protein